MKLGKKSCSGQAKVFATVKHNVGDEVYFFGMLPKAPESLQNFDPQEGIVSAIVVYNSTINYRVATEGSEREVPAKFVAKNKTELLDRFVEDMIKRWKSNYEYAKKQLKNKEK